MDLLSGIFDNSFQFNIAPHHKWLQMETSRGKKTVGLLDKCSWVTILSEYWFDLAIRYSLPPARLKLKCERHFESKKNDSSCGELELQCFSRWSFLRQQILDLIIAYLGCLAEEKTLSYFSIYRTIRMDSVFFLMNSTYSSSFALCLGVVWLSKRKNI